jgi:hypothetical protein
MSFLSLFMRQCPAAASVARSSGINGLQDFPSAAANAIPDAPSGSRGPRTVLGKSWLPINTAVCRSSPSNGRSSLWRSDPFQADRPAGLLALRNRPAAARAPVSRHPTRQHHCAEVLVTRIVSVHESPLLAQDPDTIRFTSYEEIVPG